MRKFFRTGSIALMSLMGMASIVACSSSDDASDDPNVNPAESVKTSFTLSVALPQNSSNSAKPATRVADNIAQINGNDFRGIDNINLIPFGTTITESSTRLSSNISLPSLSKLTATAKAQVYNDVSVPTGTSHFLFYGKAVDATAGTSASAPEDMFKYGTLTAANISDGVLDNITFTPTSIVGENTSNAVATAIATYLTNIATTKYTPSGEGTTELTWATYASDNATKPLGQLYNNFISLNAGSSTDVEDAVQELYTSLENLKAGDNGNDLNANEVALKTAIENNILNSTYASKAASQSGTTNTSLTFTSALAGYPGNLNLPDGAASLSFKDNAFTENTAPTSLSDNTQAAALSSYAYPVSLWYFANTPIKTSDAAISNQYADTAHWDNILKNYDNGDGVVSATTRSIALENQIQYSVGRLEASVKAADATLLDKNGVAVTVSDNTFPVTAFIIGGQRVQNWEFKPKDITPGASQYSLYDKAQSESYATTAGSKTNQTLVLETPSSQDVNIAVELQNNSGKPFQGKNGIIPAGSKFYLVAKLTPSSATNKSENSIDQVFKQDYVTKATLTISKNEKTTENDKQETGLGAAYNVIPDLRTPALSIGMSVDLQWQTGLTFNVVL